MKLALTEDEMGLSDPDTVIPERRSGARNDGVANSEVDSGSAFGRPGMTGVERPYCVFTSLKAIARMSSSIFVGRAT